MTNKITAKEVKQKLRRISKERGYGYTYEAPRYEDEYGELVQASECYYSDRDGKPSCIVGVLLHDVAPDTYRRLHQFEWDDIDYEPRCASIGELYAEGNSAAKVTGVELSDIFEPEAIRALAEAQRIQDRGTSWGKAVDAVAERY